MNPFGRLAAAIGIQNVAAAVAMASVLLILGGTAAWVMWGSDASWSSGLQEASMSAPRYVDLDEDGLADALENRIGSDPEKADTLGGGVPDGWLFHWYGETIDWNDTALLQSPVLVPPHHALPAPLQEPGALQQPSLQHLYELESSWRDPASEGGAWWLSQGTLDPRGWDNNLDGIADAWLLVHDTDPLAVEPDASAPGDPFMTLQDKYEEGLDPTRRDSDGDGLDDVAELEGTTRFGTRDHRFAATDPLRFSTRGDGIADGYLVRFSLDPMDPTIAAQTPAGDGVSVLEAFLATRDHCQAACDWGSRLQTGPLLDPTHWDSFGDGVPDAWSLRDPSGLAHPLQDATKGVVYTTEDWDKTGWDASFASLHGVVTDDHNPAPEAPHKVTLHDLYAYQRPATWDEAADGPWWEGLPTQIEPVQGALPPAVALRGWWIEVDTGLGRNASVPANQDDLRTSNVTANPLLPDTDGDGLTDVEEYFGAHAADQTRFGRTDPSNPDTDGDGLTDGDEFFQWHTDPLRRDTSGSFLTDGEEVEEWQVRHKNALEDAQNMDRGLFEEEYGWLLRSGDGDLTVEMLARLGPTGDIDDDGTSNIMDRDSDGDGLPDGAEIMPKFLGRPSKQERPATDPARVDTDGDSLPDPWEIQWSRPQDHSDELGEDGGWPLDPTKPKSDPDASWESDREADLAGDEVRVSSTGAVERFTNWDAYVYDLDPYKPDTSGDGISDMFAIHWGIQDVPQSVVDHVNADAQAFGWALEARDRLGLKAVQRGVDDLGIDVVIIDPTSGSQTVTRESNLLGMFPDGAVREKGTWIYSDVTCGVTALPDTGDDQWPHRSEGGMGAGSIPSRAGLEAPCWEWVPYPLSSDISNRTNPWLHDFDDDGLPDGWEMHYGAPHGFSADQLSDGSLQGVDPNGVRGSCLDVNLHGGLDLPPGRLDFCLRYLDAYALGIDPTLRDTDDGGLPDWLEVALGLDPLDALDDAGEEDWDGDGALNRVEDALGTNRFSPDTDGDGLLDGDTTGVEHWDGDGRPPFLDFLEPKKGNGNLCLRHGDDLITSSSVDGEAFGGMATRPPSPLLGGEGAINHTQRFDLYVDLGILHREPAGRCDDMPPYEENGALQPYTLFKREGYVDQWGADRLILGSGGGADPLQWDTAGEGLVDGWVVYWRDAAGTNNQLVTGSLDPNSKATASSDADGDTNTLNEYVWGRPAAWMEGRDGPWWGGLSPTTTDTDRDASWYESLQVRDGLDHDIDNDGIPDAIDPFPSIDHDNKGIIAWNATQGRHITNFTALWPALLTRPDTHLLDTWDAGDLVPDVIDRARVRLDSIAIVQEGVAVEILTKDGTPFEVTGQLMTHETPRTGTTYSGSSAPAEEQPVRHATVKAVLLDSDGQTAVVGAGFTNETGHFHIHASVAETVTGPALDCTTPCASVAGHLVADTAPVMASTAQSLAPGPIKLHVVVEPNDPGIQPVCFGASCNATTAAFKDTPFTVPRHTPDPKVFAKKLTAVVLLGDRTGPDPEEKHVRHDAEAIFPALSDPAPLSLQAPTILDLDLPGGALLTGQDLEIAGSLTDTGDAPLDGRPVHVTVASGSGTVREQNLTTDEDGMFAASLDTSDLGPGAYTITATSALLPSDKFLTPPDAASGTQLFSQDLRWHEIRLADKPFQGFTTKVDAGQPLNVSARLIDHLGLPVDGRDVTLTLSSPAAGDFLVLHPGSTQDGRFSHTLPALETVAPLGPVKLVVEASLGAGDTAAPASIGMEPLFSTTVELLDAKADVGQDARLQGRLLRSSPAGPVPVTDQGPDVRFQFLSGDDAHIVARTDAQGRFTLLVREDQPMQRDWSVQFLGHPEKHLGASGWTHATATHMSRVVLSIPAPEALRNHTVELAGALHLPDGTPVPGENVSAEWKAGGPATNATTTMNGTYQISLQERDTEGVHTAIVRFAGTATLHPAQKEVDAQVRVPTVLELDAPDLLVQTGGTATRSITGSLHDDRGNPLESRRVTITLSGPDETVLEQVTGKDGSFAVRAEEFLPAPGAWTVRATYPGTDMEAPALVDAGFNVTHRVLLVLARVPATLDPGAPALVAGTSEAAIEGLGPFDITVTLGDVPIGRATASSGGPWTLHFTTPSLPRGEYTLKANGSQEAGLQIIPATTVMNVTSPVQVDLEETQHTDGTRQATLLARHIESRGNIADMELVLVRRADDGRVIGVHTLRTDATGTAVLQLSAHETGQLHVVSFSDPSLHLAKTDHSVVLASNVAAAPGWTWIHTVATGLGIMAIGLVSAYAVWRRRHRHALEQLFSDAHEAMLDPSASPEEVIRWTYKRTLAALAAAGYVPKDSETVRDIAGHAARAFRLPRAPMDGLTQLFEIAVFSRTRLHAGHRDHALRCLQHLSRHLQAQEVQA